MKFKADFGRHGHGHPLLQGRGQHRHAHRQPVVRRPARCWPRRRSPARRASGWQHVDFSTPVTITAGTTYVASLLRAQRPLLGHQRRLQLRASTTRRCTRSPTARSANGVYAYSRAQHVPDQQLRRQQLLGRRALRARRRRPARSTGVTATAGQARPACRGRRRRPAARRRSYTITPYIGSTAQTPTTVTGTPPATSKTVTGLTAGTAYTFTVTASNPSGSGPELRRIQRGHADRRRRAGGADRRHGRGRHEVRARELDRAERRRRQRDHRLHGHAVRRHDGAGRRSAVDASTTKTRVTGLTNGTAYTFKVAATNARRDRPRVGRLERRHAAGLDLRVHDAGASSTPATRARSCWA